MEVLRDKLSFSKNCVRLSTMSNNTCLQSLESFNVNYYNWCFWINTFIHLFIYFSELYTQILFYMFLCSLFTKFPTIFLIIFSLIIFLINCNTIYLLMCHNSHSITFSQTKQYFVWDLYLFKFILILI